MGTYDDLLATTRQLGGDKLLFVVFLERRSKFGDQFGFIDGQSLDVCENA